MNVLVMADELPEPFYPDLLKFAAHYSPSGIVELEIAGENRSVLYQAVPVMDLEKAHSELSQIEEGWQLKDDGKLLIPPLESKIPYDKFRDVLRSASYEAMTLVNQDLLNAA